LAADRRACFVLAAFCAVAGACAAGKDDPGRRRELGVCADPNNMPFSNERREGFENRIAELVAREMNTTVRYTWWAQRRGFVRNTLRAGACDVVIGVPSSYEMVRPTRPYYRSSYVFVSRTDRHLDLSSLDDPRLRKLRIGLHIVGDDYGAVPPAQALASRGIVRNIVGYNIYGDYSLPDPPARLIHAVAAGEIDVAMAWGPLAGYFARQEEIPLDVKPVSPEIDLPFVPLVFDISMGVRREDVALQEQLDTIISRRGAEIDRILESYGIPFSRRIRRTAAR
jgi:mxaJ protein